MKLQPEINLQHTLAVAAALFIHVLLFVPSNVTFGVVSGLFLIIPAALAGWWFGIRGGLIAGGIGVLLHSALAIGGAHTVPPDVLHLIPVFTLLPTAGLAAGMFRDARSEAQVHRLELLRGEAAFAEERASWLLTEKTLRLMEREYFSMISHTHDGIAIVTDGKIEFCNTMFREIAGIENVEDLRNTNILDLLSPSGRQAMKARLFPGPGDAVLLPRFETEFEHAGTRIAVEVTMTPHDFKGGDSYLVVIRDISERRQAELAVAHSVSLLQATLESAIEGVLAVDRSGRIVAHNSRFMEIWAIPEDVLAQGDEEAVTAAMETLCSDVDMFHNPIRDETNEQDKDTHDYVFLLDGRIIERHSRPQLVNRIHAGRVWSFRDITNEFRTSEELRLSTETLRSIVESMEDGILLLDVNDAVIDGTDTTLRMLGCECREHLVGKNFSDFAADDSAPRILEMLEVAWDTGMATLQNVILRSESGADVAVNLTATALAQSTGSDPRLLVRLRDMRPRVCLDAERRTATELGESLERILTSRPAIAFVWRDEERSAVEFVSSNIQALGYTRDEFLKGEISYMSLVHPEDTVAVLGRSHAAQSRDDGLKEIEYRLCAKDGVYRWVRERSWSHRSYEDGEERIEGSLVEIALSQSTGHTQHSSYNRSLREQNRFNRAVTD